MQARSFDFLPKSWTKGISKQIVQRPHEEGTSLPRPSAHHGLKPTQ